MEGIKMKTIGEKIAIARKNKNMTQTDIAGKIKITPQMVSKWERDESLPDIITLKRLSEILEVSVSYFYDEADEDDAFITSCSSKTINAKKRANLNEHRWDCNDFTNSDLTDFEFRYARFVKCNLTGCDITDKNLSYTEFISCNLTKTVFKNSKLLRIDILAGYLHSTDFSEAKLNKSDFKKCDIKEADFTNAVFNKTDFEDSVMEKVEFKGATLKGCSFKRHKFKQCHFVNTVFDKCKLKDVTFEDCTASRLSYNFLLACKADVSGVKLLFSP